MVAAETIKLMVIVGLGITGSIPTIILYRYYLNTKIIDYLLMGTAFLVTVSQAILIVILNEANPSLLLFQINDVLYVTFILMFLLHGMRLKWETSPISLKVIVASWYLGITLSVLFYDLIVLPDRAQVVFFHLRNTSSRVEGQMLIINDLYIIGRGFEFYAHAFRVFSIAIILYAYAQTKNIAEAMSVTTSRRVFIAAIVSAAVYPVVLMGEMLNTWTIHQAFEWHVFDLITYLCVAFICIRYPETLLISRTQIIRAINIHKDYQETDEHLTDTSNMSLQISDYLKTLQSKFPDLFKGR